MKYKYIATFLIILLIANSALAENVVVRNDNAATKLLPTNGQSTGPISGDEYGRIFVLSSTNALSGAIDASLAFGSVSTTYATLLTNSTARRIVTVYNGLDVAVMISANGTNGFGVVAPGASAIYNLAINSLHVATNISVKSLGSAPTSGTVYITATQ